MSAHTCFMNNDNSPALKPIPLSPARLAMAQDVSAVLDTNFFTALCEPVRVMIIRRLIAIGAANVSTITQGLPQDRSVVSRHLALLERAGITQSRKSGRHVEYDLNGPDIVSKVSEILAVITPMAELCIPFADTELPQNMSTKNSIALGEI